MAYDSHFSLNFIEGRQFSHFRTPFGGIRLPGCFNEKPESTYLAEDSREQLSRHCDLRHLEDYISGMANDLGTNPNHLLPQGRHCPVSHTLR